MRPGPRNPLLKFPPSARRWVPGAALQRFGRDLTEEARRGLLDPVVGREQVVERVLQVRVRAQPPCGEHLV